MLHPDRGGEDLSAPDGHPAGPDAGPGRRSARHRRAALFDGGLAIDRWDIPGTPPERRSARARIAARGRRSARAARPGRRPARWLCRIDGAEG